MLLTPNGKIMIFFSWLLPLGCNSILNAPDEEWEFDAVYAIANFDDDDENADED